MKPSETPDSSWSERAIHQRLSTGFQWSEDGARDPEINDFPKDFAFFKDVGDTISAKKPADRETLLRDAIIPGINSFAVNSIQRLPIRTGGRGRGYSPYETQKYRRHLRSTLIKMTLGLNLSGRIPKKGELPAPEGYEPDTLHMNVTPIVQEEKNPGKRRDMLTDLAKKAADVLLQTSPENEEYALQNMVGDVEIGAGEVLPSGRETTRGETFAKVFLDELLIELAQRMPAQDQKELKTIPNPAIVVQRSGTKGIVQRTVGE